VLVVGGVLVEGVLVPLGEAAGGQGVPVGVMPGVPGVPEVLCLFPEVAGEVEGEVDDDDPGLEDPAFGVELSGVPGKVQGVVALGSIGEGWVLLPGAGVFGEFEPGTEVIGGGVVGGVELPGGVTGVPCGVAVLPVGVAGLAGGVAVPGV
jgi:hypothetical protein